MVPPPEDTSLDGNYWRPRNEVARRDDSRATAEGRGENNPFADSPPHAAKIHPTVTPSAAPSATPTRMTTPQPQASASGRASESRSNLLFTAAKAASDAVRAATGKAKSMLDSRVTLRRNNRVGDTQPTLARIANDVMQQNQTRINYGAYISSPINRYNPNASMHSAAESAGAIAGAQFGGVLRDFGPRGQPGSSAADAQRRDPRTDDVPPRKLNMDFTPTSPLPPRDVSVKAESDDVSVKAESDDVSVNSSDSEPSEISEFDPEQKELYDDVYASLVYASAALPDWPVVEQLAHQVFRRRVRKRRMLRGLGPVSIQMLAYS